MSENLSRLLCGDCLDILPSVPDDSVDMVLCDPPYGMTRNHWDVVIPVEDMWMELKRVTKARGAIVLMAKQPFASQLVMSNTRMFRYELIWEKSSAGGFLNARRFPLQAHENIMIFYRKLPVYNPQMAKGEPYKVKSVTNGDGGAYGNFERKGKININKGERFPRSVIRIANPNNKSLHTAQKPIGLMEYLIKMYTDEGDTVLDFAMGSGTTCVAASSLGRRYIGIEMDADYYDLAKGRFDIVDCEKGAL